MRRAAAVLKLRPPNVANRIHGRQRTCVLNGRDVLRACEDVGVVLVCELPVVAPVATGILQAARQLDSVIGLSFPVRPRGEAMRPSAFFEQVLTCAEEAGYRRPMFLRAGPVFLSEAGEGEIAAAREAAFALVDAGFTELCVDLSGLEPSEGAAAFAQIAGAALERELAVEVVGGEPSAEAMTALAAALAGQGAQPDVISLPKGMAAGLEDFTELATAVSPARLGLCEPLPANLPGSGARVAIAAKPFHDVIERALPEDLREKIFGRMRESGCALGSALAFFHREIAALEGHARVRMEALAYTETVELLEQAGAVGTGARAVEFLAERSGY